MQVQTKNRRTKRKRTIEINVETEEFYLLRGSRSQVATWCAQCAADVESPRAASPEDHVRGRPQVRDELQLGRDAFQASLEWVRVGGEGSLSDLFLRAMNVVGFDSLLDQVEKADDRS